MSDNGVHPSGRLNDNAPAGPQLYNLLCESIVRGELEPGTRLSEIDIGKSYGVSRQPVREAFIKLADSALITVLPQRGSYVGRIDLVTVSTAQFVGEAFEADIVRRLAFHGEPSALAVFDEMLAAQAKAVATNNLTLFMEFDEAFHYKLAELAGVGAGWDFLQPLKMQMDRVRHLSAQAYPCQILLEQHVQIIDAIKNGAPDEAELKMRQHLQQMGEHVRAATIAHPDYFDVELP